MNQKLSREELIEIAKKIINMETETDEEEDDLLELFADNVPDPNVTDYFFETEWADLTAEEIVDKSLSYKPIQL
ncbi:hypothetical protein QWZ06_14140 [Chryseobacterium tructae]|uniref:Colicin immunity protein / pyocin immunity protein n=1 Tax=Chryseobacterium tructae TaxID=1037380 RepID=A0ABV7Y0C0_9FLAO|nr:hypothetical protein [Chryseobacterium tructae]MDN3693345.1 hypothetical protein [Chryseobacterium tructae]